MFDRTRNKVAFLVLILAVSAALPFILNWNYYTSKQDRTFTTNNRLLALHC